MYVPGLHSVGQLIGKVLDQGAAGNSLGSVEAGVSRAGTTAGGPVRGTGHQRSHWPRKQGTGPGGGVVVCLQAPGARPRVTAKRGRDDAERVSEVLRPLVLDGGREL